MASLTSIFEKRKSREKHFRELSLFQLKMVAEIFNSILGERKEIAQLIYELHKFAIDHDHTFAEMKFDLNHEGSADKIKNHIRKPRLVLLNMCSQFFYCSNEVLLLVSSDNEKLKLMKDGVKVYSFSELEDKYVVEANKVIKSENLRLLHNYNLKVDSWNEWAAANGAEILSKRFV